jgi:hypothetical protein
LVVPVEEEMVVLLTKQEQMELLQLVVAEEAAV